MPSQSEAQEFDRLHGIGSNAVHSIFTDRDPSTSIKGCGFRNRSTALQTLLLIEQPGSRYKQYWTVRAMLERAKRHPIVAAAASSSTNGMSQKSSAAAQNMQAAVDVFERWLKWREESSESVPMVQYLDDRTPSCGSIARPWPRFDAAEMALRKRFASCRILNRHGGTAEQEKLHGDDMQRRLRQDQAEAKAALRRAVANARSSGPSAWFDLAGHAFSSVFGGPGIHGYGTLQEIAENTDNESAVAHFPSQDVSGEEQRSIEKLLVSVRATGSSTAQPTSGGNDCLNGQDQVQSSWLSSLQKSVGVKKHLLLEEETSWLQDPGGLASLDLGKAFDACESFTLEYDVCREKARFTCWKLTKGRPPGDANSPMPRSIQDFFLKKRKRDDTKQIAVEDVVVLSD